MTDTKPILPVMTAIAAVLAFSTPAMAQEVTPAPVTTPVTASPAPVSPPVSTIAPDVDATSASDPLSPEAAPRTPPVAVNKVKPSVSSTKRSSRAAPAPRRATTAPAPIRPRAAAPPPVAPTAPVETASIPATTALPLAIPVAPPVPAAQPAAQPARAEISSDNGLEIAGAAGLGLLALLGMGAALRRRSRREQDEFVAVDEPVAAPMAPAAFAEPKREPTMRRAAPVVATAPAMVGKPIAAPGASLPDGFDLSRFGPHVQAAYRGPTEDNASLSLKHRLRRASAMDQMARRDGTEAVASTDHAARAPTLADAGTVVSRMRPVAASSDGFMLGTGAVRPSLRPITQH